MTFDPTITGGSILQALVLLVGFAVAFTKIGGRIDLLAQRLKTVEEAIKKLSDNDTRVAILEERVTNHGKMIATNQLIIEDLRRGKGFIAGNRQSVDGGYGCD
jgi:hypothetical protein